MWRCWMRIRAAVLVTSDRISQGLEQDRSGRAAAEILSELGEVVETRVVPDDFDRIVEVDVDKWFHMSAVP